MNANLTPAVLLNTLHARYATKLFDATKTIPDATWAALEASLVLTPSSFGLQPWKFIVIRDQALREQLLPESWGQRQVVDCSHFVVFARRETTTADDITAFIQLTADTRGIPAATLDGYKAMMTGFAARHPDLGNWAGDQVYIALGQFMAACALLGIDACPMEGILPAKFDEILGLKGTGYATQVACAVGYRSADDKYATAAKVRFPAATVIEHR
jgi:nitroreductase